MFSVLFLFIYKKKIHKQTKERMQIVLQELIILNNILYVLMLTSGKEEMP